MTDDKGNSSTTLRNTFSTVEKASEHDDRAIAHRKPCHLCQKPSDVLIRCRTDETRNWHFICTGKCWKHVSGGVQDGPDKPYYQYGGMWKNKHAGVSAKKSKKKSKKRPDENVRSWVTEELRYVVNDKVWLDGVIWVCRRSHYSGEGSRPGRGYAYWKEANDAQTKTGRPESTKKTTCYVGEEESDGD